MHLLVEAFEKLKTDKKLVLIGGSPNPDEYETKIKSTTDKRIIFPGYVYGDDTNILIQNAFSYIQPSLIEGLSPVILTVMGLGTPTFVQILWKIRLLQKIMRYISIQVMQIH